MAFDVDGPVGRAMQKMATSAWFRTVGPKVVPPMDRVLNRATGGRLVVSSLLVPSMVLTTTGRKSGEPRTCPLACMPDGDGWYVVGSNFGRDHHPAWTGNLLADPRATVTYRGTTTEVEARLLDDAEKSEVWPRLVSLWPAYDTYVEVSGRNIRVFRLAPV